MSVRACTRAPVSVSACVRTREARTLWALAASVTQCHWMRRELPPPLARPKWLDNLTPRGGGASAVSGHRHGAAAAAPAPAAPAARAGWFGAPGVRDAHVRAAERRGERRVEITADVPLSCPSVAAVTSPAQQHLMSSTSSVGPSRASGGRAHARVGAQRSSDPARIEPSVSKPRDWNLSTVTGPKKREDSLWQIELKRTQRRRKRAARREARKCAATAAERRGAQLALVQARRCADLKFSCVGPLPPIDSAARATTASFEAAPADEEEGDDAVIGGDNDQ